MSVAVSSGLLAGRWNNPRWWDSAARTYAKVFSVASKPAIRGGLSGASMMQFLPGPDEVPLTPAGPAPTVILS